MQLVAWTATLHDALDCFEREPGSEEGRDFIQGNAQSSAGESRVRLNNGMTPFRK